MFVKKSQGLAETGKGMLKDMMKKGAEGDSYFEDKRAFLHIHHSNAKASGKSIARIHKAGSGQRAFFCSPPSICSSHLFFPRRPHSGEL